MEFLGKIFACILAVYLGNYAIEHWSLHSYGIGIAVGVAMALSLTY